MRTITVNVDDDFKERIDKQNTRRDSLRQRLFINIDTISLYFSISHATLRVCQILLSR